MATANSEPDVINIRLLSVPHTGTRSTRKILEDADFCVDQVHFSCANNPLIYERDSLAVIPIRDREEVLKSWQRRKKDTAALYDAWEEMERYIDEHDDVYVLHIDDPGRRDADLRAISQRVDYELTADFDLKVGQGM